ncbi:unnamed protein product [Haemonchus placei]|uniref:Secreted protein n=1 Tax=Haemonchus placei TaxID=6290 RepID=A0A0N4WGA1_HAEPC|nr:unnamed protein product [Haemonchus placei]
MCCLKLRCNFFTVVCKFEIVIEQFMNRTHEYHHCRRLTSPSARGSLRNHNSFPVHRMVPLHGRHRRQGERSSQSHEVDTEIQN